MAKSIIPPPNTPMIDKNGSVNIAWRKWFENIGKLVPETDVIPKTSLPDDVQTSSSANANAAGRLFLAADGETVSFGGTYGTTPRLIEPDTKGLPALAAGSSYDVKAINATPTGFTAYAKSITVTGYTDHTTGAGSYDSGLGYHTAQKPVTADAYNQSYSFDFSGSLVIQGYEHLGGGTYLTTYCGKFEIYAYISGVWVKTSTETIEITDITTVNPPTYTISNQKIVALITQTIGMVAGAEFGIKAIQGSVTALNEVTYQTQTASAPVSIGTQKLQWRVYA